MCYPNSICDLLLLPTIQFAISFLAFCYNFHKTLKLCYDVVINYLLFSGVGPTQQLSTYSDSRETTTRPLPEESEYFYEDFVEYEENSTLPYNLSQYSSTYSTSSSTESNVQTIPPGVLSHFIPGDTPTLYAGTRPQTTTPQIPSTNTKQPNTAFTFFGMPLPSLGKARKYKCNLLLS